MTAGCVFQGNYREIDSRKTGLRKNGCSKMHVEKISIRFVFKLNGLNGAFFFINHSLPFLIYTIYKNL